MESTILARLKQCWLSLSVKHRLYFFNTITIVVSFLVVSTLYIGMHSLMGTTNQILDTNEVSLHFQIAMEQEQKAFVEWVLGNKEQSLDDLTKAVSLTRQAVDSLEQLPSQTQNTEALMCQIWGITNSYQRYERERNALLAMNRSDEQFVLRLYQVYDMQNFLTQYAGHLTQIVIQQGSDAYLEKQSQFRYLPLIPVMFIAITIGLLITIGRIMERFFITPIIELAHDAKELSNRHFDGVLTPRQEQDEITQLIEAFTRMKQAMVTHIATLQENSELQIQMEEMQLEILKSQINPHFLFNTLNTISCMAQIEDAATTDRMILSLSRLFQYSLNSTETVAPLRQEFKIAEDYLYLQKMRFEERITYTLSMAPETAHALVPSFLLQPLVENAIVHGIGKKEEGGRILVESRIEGTKLWIRVKDNGIGMAPDVLEDVRAGRKRPENGHGIGLGNIQKRVTLMYPDSEVRVDSKPEKGTVIQIGFTEIT